MSDNMLREKIAVDDEDDDASWYLFAALGLLLVFGLLLALTAPVISVMGKPASGHSTKVH